MNLLPATLLIGILGSVIFLVFYYLIARRRLDAETIKATEKLRMDLGLAGRLLCCRADSWSFRCTRSRSPKVAWSKSVENRSRNSSMR